MLQDIGNTDDLTELVEQMKARMHASLKQLSDAQVNHVSEMNKRIEELESSLLDQQFFQEQGHQSFFTEARQSESSAEQRPESGGFKYW